MHSWVVRDGGRTFHECWESCAVAEILPYVREWRPTLRGCGWAAAGCATAVALALILSVVFIRVTFGRYRQTANSMAPTVVKGDVVLTRPARRINRGDLIVFLPPREKAVYLKRVIALPNEQVEMRDGVAVVDGIALREPYIRLEEGASPEIPVVRDTSAVTVPPNAFYVLGDNRDHSNDSRFIGFVKRDQIRGRVVLVVSPTHGVWRP